MKVEQRDHQQTQKKRHGTEITHSNGADRNDLDQKKEKKKKENQKMKIEERYT